MTAPMQEGHQAGTDRRRGRVAAPISAAQRDGTPLTASAIARAAAVDRAFLYRHRDLLDTLHIAAREPATPHTDGPGATRASLLADLANANARSARLAARIDQLEARLSTVLGEEAPRTARRRFGPVPGRTPAELDAARAANRDLTRALNQRG
ncbi:hypothetical protein ABT040_24145 [Streptomyces sp. NPDC002688]|uniref:hypothetical protein n=1 Tax=Streptomyces sp. NPDC002688 TaxID=3154423 RepID=UPI00331AEE93